MIKETDEVSSGLSLILILPKDDGHLWTGQWQGLTHSVGHLFPRDVSKVNTFGSQDQPSHSRVSQPPLVGS